MTTETEQKEAIRRRTLTYLRRHPNAKDALEGIAQWWLFEQRLEDETGRVKAALKCLVGQTQLMAQRASDGRTYYHAAEQNNSNTMTTNLGKLNTCHTKRNGLGESKRNPASIEFEAARCRNSSHEGARKSPHTAAGPQEFRVFEIQRPNTFIGLIGEKLGLLAAAVVVLIVSVVVLGACGLLLPVRWFIDWDARRQRERLRCFASGSRSNQSECSSVTVSPRGIGTPGCCRTIHALDCE